MCLDEGNDFRYVFASSYLRLRPDQESRAQCGKGAQTFYPGVLTGAVNSSNNSLIFRCSARIVSRWCFSSSVKLLGVRAMLSNVGDFFIDCFLQRTQDHELGDWGDPAA